MIKLLFKILLVFTLITSCSQIKYIDIQVLMPSEITTDKPIRQLTILNSPQTAKKSIIGADTSVSNLFFNILYNSIEGKLKGSPALYDAMLDISSIADYRKRYVKTGFYQRKSSYSIELDSIILRDSIFTDFDLFFDENEQLNSEKFGIHQIEYVTKFSFKNLAFDYMDKQIFLRDTIQWKYPVASSRNRLDFIKKGRIEHYKELADILAFDLAGKIVPNWNIAERQIYVVPNRLMRKAYKHFVTNDLDAAIAQWKTVYNLGTKPLASKAAFNIALSYEIMDNLLASREWINKAIAVKKDFPIIKYQKIIEQRIEERTKIDKQLWQ